MKERLNDRTTEAISRLKSLFEDNDILMKEFSSDGSKTDDEYFEFKITCWVHPNGHKVSEKQ